MEDRGGGEGPHLGQRGSRIGEPGQLTERGEELAPELEPGRRRPGTVGVEGDDPLIVEVDDADRVTAVDHGAVRQPDGPAARADPQPKHCAHLSPRPVETV